MENCSKNWILREKVNMTIFTASDQFSSHVLVNGKVINLIRQRSSIGIIEDAKADGEEREPSQF